MFLFLRRLLMPGQEHYRPCRSSILRSRLIPAAAPKLRLALGDTGESLHTPQASNRMRRIQIHSISFYSGKEVC